MLIKCDCKWENKWNVAWHVHTCYLGVWKGSVGNTAMAEDVDKANIKAAITTVFIDPMATHNVKVLQWQTNKEIATCPIPFGFGFPLFILFFFTVLIEKFFARIFWFILISFVFPAVTGSCFLLKQKKKKKKWIQHWKQGLIHSCESCSVLHEAKKVQLPRKKNDLYDRHCFHTVCFKEQEQ